MRVYDRRRLILGAAAGGVAALSMPVGTRLAAAQSDAAANYPNRPIRVVVPFAAGGGNDIFARLVAQKASEILGQSLVIENRPGAGGRPAAEWTANQEADGYTLLVAASGGMSIAAAAYPKLAYHPTKSFVPLTMISDFPLFLIVSSKHPAKTVKELVAWAKENPDKVNYASSSPAFILATETLKLASGMPATMIPYKSSGQMVLSVISGDVQLSMPSPPSAVPQIKAGQVRALAVTGSKRDPSLPDVPSMAEAGFPEVNTRLWSGVFVAAKTPPAIVERLEKVFRQAIADPGVNAKLIDMASVPGGNPSDEFRKIIDADIESYRKVIEAAKLKFN
jgi:tripartite-type tricarboxylate transporter receptor subunit TctC